jgi:site-specific DNA recombinase
MIAAIYARKSTEQTGVSDEEKSVTRQIEHAKAYAAKKGWTVPEELIFVDDGISGAEFVKRPGFIRLMNALKPKPSYQFLVMSEGSRLGREQIETAYVLKQIVDSGVRVFFYLEDRERTLDTPLEKLLLQLSNYADEQERDRARTRTYDAMVRKARLGHVTGGMTYGYDNQDVQSSEGHRLHVVRVVNPKEAVIVRQIFEMYAGGLGITRIAHHLNHEKVLAPRQNVTGWSPSAVREMLRRPLYRGQIVWNKSEKIVRGGTKKRRRRPECDRIVIDAPELRIIPADLWESVQARLARIKATGPRERDVESKYLLTGMARCAQCGGPMLVVGPGTSRREGRYYACAYHKKRGSTICKNGMLAEQELLDKVLLRSLANVLQEKVLDVAIEDALFKIRSQQDTQLDRRTQIERELSLIEATEKRLVDGIAKGDSMDPLLARLRSEETRKKELVGELDRLERLGPSELDIARLKREMKQRLADLPTLLGNHVSEGRKLLRLLFEKPIQCKAVVDDEGARYVLSGTGDFMQLAGGSAAHQAWCPQRDLNPCYCLERAMS